MWLLQPTSFANGRYQVKQFLSEGGKKRVYLAHDTLLEREVAFALIKTEGLDAISRTRISREAQAMGPGELGCRHNGARRRRTTSSITANAIPARIPPAMASRIKWLPVMVMAKKVITG